MQRAAFDRIEEVLQEMIEPALLRMYWAHTTLNQLHWAILGNQEEVIDLFSRFGESRLD